MTNKFENTFADWVIEHRWRIIITVVIWMAIFAPGLTSITFMSDYRIYFSKDNPQLLAFEELENTYTKDDNVLIVIEPKDGNVFTRETLSIVQEITEQSWQVPYSNRVDSITNFQYTEADEDSLIVRDLVDDAKSLSDEEIKQIRQIALTEPLLLRNLISDRGHVTAINITVQHSEKDTGTGTPEVVNYVRDLVETVRNTHPEVNVYLSGNEVFTMAFAETSRHDLMTLIPLSFMLMFCIMFLLIRNLTGTLCTIILIMIAITTGMGIGSYAGIPLSPASATSPTIILTVSIANCIHILTTFLRSVHQGTDKDSALKESLRVNLQPVFLASLTTTLGFLTLNFSDAPPFRHLGNFVAAGVVTSFMLSVTFLPALMSILPVRIKPVSSNSDKLISRFSHFVVRRRTHLLWGMAAIIILLISGLPLNELNDNTVDYFDETTTFRQHTDFMIENLTGLYRIEYSLESGEPQGVSDPQFLKDIEAFTDWYRQQPEVLFVRSFTDTMKRLNKNMHGDDEDMYRIPDKRDLAAQYLLLYEMSLPYGLDLNNQINIDKSSIHLTVVIQTVTSNEFLLLDQRAQQWLADNTTSIKAWEGSGINTMFAHITQRNISRLLIGTTIALIFISFVLMIAFRSIKIGLISLVPNLIPAAMGFGIWGYFVAEVGVGLSVVTTMTLGIIVDDTVHFLSKYLRARRENNMYTQDAVHYAFKTVGRALIITSIILAVGFLVLTTSTFKLNSAMGLLTSIIIMLALIADFLFLPPLLMKIEEKADAEALTTDTVTDSASA